MFISKALSRSDKLQGQNMLVYLTLPTRLRRDGTQTWETLCTYVCMQAKNEFFFFLHRPGNYCHAGIDTAMGKILPQGWNRRAEQLFQSKIRRNSTTYSIGVITTPQKNPHLLWLTPVPVYSFPSRLLILLSQKAEATNDCYKTFLPSNRQQRD